MAGSVRLVGQKGRYKDMDSENRYPCYDLCVASSKEE